MGIEYFVNKNRLKNFTHTYKKAKEREREGKRQKKIDR